VQRHAPGEESACTPEEGSGRRVQLTFALLALLVPLAPLPLALGAPRGHWPLQGTRGAGGGSGRRLKSAHQQRGSSCVFWCLRISARPFPRLQSISKYPAPGAPASVVLGPAGRGRSWGNSSSGGGTRVRKGSGGPWEGFTGHCTRVYEGSMYVRMRSEGYA